MSLVIGLFFLVILLNQQWSPPLRLQSLHCSTFRIIIIIIIIIKLLCMMLTQFRHNSFCPVHCQNKTVWYHDKYKTIPRNNTFIEATTQQK
jgi:hypothetical protein